MKINIFLAICVWCVILETNCEYNSEPHNDEIQTDLKKEGGKEARRNEIGEKILSRKRRYLVFPEGSSFQVVWDGIIPIVDYTNYLILGITVALAWELPSKPPSEIIEELKDKLNDGTLGLHRNDTINKIEYLDKDFKINQNINTPSFYTPGHNIYYSKPTPGYLDKYYNKNWKYDNFYNNSNTLKYDGKPYELQGDKFNNFYSKSWTKNGAHWKILPPEKYNSAYKYTKYSKIPTERFHRVYPVFGKRSIPDEVHPYHRRVRRDIKMNKIDKIHLRYHRSTRHDLYGRIEKYLQTRGKNGQECVLRALCETGKRGDETNPGSFVVEIMRAIFTLPENHINDTIGRHKLYDEAHSYEGSCANKFQNCKDSIWSKDFVF